MTGTIAITTRATTIPSITLIYMTTKITMRRRAVTMLPTENSDVGGDAEDPYVNYVDHINNGQNEGQKKMFSI